MGDYITTVRQYDASDGVEYFISIESKDNKILYGFTRLRIPGHASNCTFPELDGCGLLRELHVYGVVIPCHTHGKQHVQHNGLGRKLIEKACEICKDMGLSKLAVIPGEGVRRYYERNDFKEMYREGRYMIRDFFSI